MTIRVGTSGYNYQEWKGSFYPQTLPAAKMLPYYAERFPTVEINYTFYRMPTEKIVDGWNRATPQPYALTLKAPKRITHDARLRNCADRVQQCLDFVKQLPEGVPLKVEGFVTANGTFSGGTLASAVTAMSRLKETKKAASVGHIPS